MQMTCPSSDELRSYLVGDCDDALLAEIERHLADCPACEDTVAQLGSVDDTLTRHLPLAAANAGAASPGWLDRLRLGPPAEVPAGTEAAPPLELAPPTGFASYELLGILGQGGMGVVYRARHRQLNRVVALKVLNPRMMAAAEARRRFEREIQILGSLDHPGVVMATDAGRVGAAAYLVMELVQGSDLARLVRQSGPLTVAEACSAARQMAEALAAAHAAGAIHRDVKPSNAIVDRQGRVKLVDFGLAHLAELASESRETSLGRLLGTLDYMAPEQGDTNQPIDARVDLYGLGATLFYLLTGRPPHGDTRRTVFDQIRALATEEPPRVQSLRADVPRELDDLIARLLSRDPAQRPASATAAAEELAAWATGDLSARVAEVAPPPSDITEAERSLSQLLGTDASSTSPTGATQGAPSQLAPSGSGSGRRRFAWFLSAAAGAAALVYGVTILLNTSQGTFRIESEVAGIQIELIDEDENTQQLTINRGDNETRLSAGQYRVRIASPHENISLDKSTITLHHGQEVVARITQVDDIAGEATADRSATTSPTTVVVPSINVLPPAASPAGDPLYQDKPESIWRQRFSVETSAIAKLNAATALVILAGTLPEKENLEQLLQIGGDVVEAAWGQTDLEVVFWLQDRNDALWDLRSNPQSSSQVHAAYSGFLESAKREALAIAAKIPTTSFASTLSDAITSDQPHQSSFATFLLYDEAGIRSRLASDPKAIDILLQVSDGLQSSPMNAASFALVLGRFHGQANPQQQQLIRLELERSAEYMFADRKQLFPKLYSPWMSVTLDIPELAQTAARLDVCRLVDDSRPVALDRMPKEYWARKADEPFVGHWIAELNQALQTQRGEISPGELISILQVLDRITKLRRPDDAWDVATTADLLTKELQRFYVMPGETAQVEEFDLETSQHRHLTAARFLSLIVRMTGKIPEIARSGEPRSEYLRRQLANFQEVLNYDRNDSEGQTRGNRSLRLTALSESMLQFDNFVNLAPYQAWRIALSPSEPPKSIASRLGFSNRRVAGGENADLLLLLAIMADLSGENDHRDEMIAFILEERFARTTYSGGIKELTASDSAMGSIARDLLEQMAGKTKNERLLDDIRHLNLTTTAIVSADSTPSSPAPSASATEAGGTSTKRTSTPAPTEPLYQAKTEAEWNRIFAAETAPMAKLEAAQALVALASTRAPEEYVDRVVEVGGAVLAAAAGEQHTRFWAGQGIYIDQAWALGSDKELQKQFEAFTQRAGTVLQTLPPKILAHRLSDAIVNGQPAESSFAHILERSAIRPRVASSPEAVSIVMQKLAGHVEPLTFSAATTFIRARFYASASEQDRQQTITDMNVLASKLLERKDDADADPSRKELIRRWLSLAMISGSDAISLPCEVSARLVLEEIVAHDPHNANQYFLSEWFRDQSIVYADAWTGHVRERTAYFVSAWPQVVASYAAQHTDLSSKTRWALARSIDYTTRLHYIGDDWDLEPLAKYAEDQLRSYYTGEPTDASPEDLLGTTPELLLTQLARIRGELPEFVRTGGPRSRDIVKRLDALQQAITAGGENLRSNSEFKGLLEAAPVEVLTMIRHVPPKSEVTVHDLLVATAGKDRTNSSALNGNKNLPYTDPMLLLAILATLTGESDEQDARVADCFSNRYDSQLFTRHIRDVLTGPWTMKTIAKDRLRHIYETTKNEKLKEEVARLDPSLTDSPAMQGSSSTP